MAKIIVAFLIGIFFGRAVKDSEEYSDKMWITEKCGTNTPPPCCPKHPAHIGYVDEIDEMIKDLEE